MNIPDALLNKTTRYVLSGDVTPRLLEEGIKYLGSFFDSEEKYFDFLLKLDKDRYDDFLYTIFFYWAHDLYQYQKRIEFAI